MPAEEAVIEQLNRSKIPDGLKSGFKSNNSTLSSKAVVVQSGAENWLITDGSEMYSLKKNEDQLNIYSSCKRVDVICTESGKIGMRTYIVKGPVIYHSQYMMDDMVYPDFDEKYFEPMLASFEPIVVIR